jgi:hypothetical protein
LLKADPVSDTQAEKVNRAQLSQKAVGAFDAATCENVENASKNSRKVGLWNGSPEARDAKE